MTLVTRDQATGLRRNPIRWPDGRPPSPAGCRWCGFEQRIHARLYVPSRGWHTWELPTTKQMMLRMQARRRANEAAKATRERLKKRDEQHDWVFASRPASWPTGPGDKED